MPQTSIYIDSMADGICRGCKARIVWATNMKTDRRMPFDAPVVPLGTWTHPITKRVIGIVSLERSHFGTCPKASEFSRKVSK